MVESLGEAEEAAAEINPQLFVIDFDPPHPNAIEFLNRMGQAHPDARVLAIASGTSPKFASERYGPNAIQFVEKPFELADFGAAVQALLGPWTEASSGDSRGTLRDLNLRDLVPIECVSGATAVLKIEAGGERAGEIHFLDGHICHASTANLSGAGALQEMMRWKNARGTETERPVDAPRSIQGPWHHVFLEALRQAKPSAEELEVPVSAVSSLEESKASKTRAKTGKKILVIDDTEMLLIFVEDSLALADPSLQIVTAFTGGEGARRAEVMIPDLVLLDYSLPDLRGDQICERLLQNEATARIPVVMMSGHVPEMMATAERYPNVVATIAKPFMSEALIQLVEETLALGALPGDAKGKAASGWTITGHPVSLASPEPAPVRDGNGKKPARKSASPKSPAKELPERAAVSAPPPIEPAPLPPQETSTEPLAAKIPDPPLPASLIQVAEPVPQVAPASSPAPAVRDIRPVEPALFEPPPLPAVRPATLAGSSGGAVVLNLGMEVISVQFTPRFQIGTIRAKLSATTLSLTQLLMPTVAEDRWGAGFELGAVALDPDGRIRTMRVRPTRRPGRFNSHSERLRHQ